MYMDFMNLLFLILNYHHKRNQEGYICIKLNKNFKSLLFTQIFAIILYLFNNALNFRYQRANWILLF